MKILKTVQKVPGGMMVIPLLLGVVINTVCPSVLQAGGYEKHGLLDEADFDQLVAKYR